jgi:hypothetical protein
VTNRRCRDRATIPFNQGSPGDGESVVDPTGSVGTANLTIATATGTTPW